MPAITQIEIDAIGIPDLAREIASDIESDFIIAPHYAVVLKQNGEDFVRSVLMKLKGGYPGPRPPIQLLIPKSAHHYRPGAILEPFDRVVYHIISSLAFDSVGNVDGDRAVSVAERTLADFRNGTNTRHSAWDVYREGYVRLTESMDWAMTLDLAHYFERVPQHALVNLLTAEGISSNTKSLAETFLQNVRMRDSHGILQGLLPSDYLGDLFLTNLDAFIERSGYESIRFVDDVLVAADSAEDLRNLYRETSTYLRGFGLQPNESKTRIVPSREAKKAHTAIDDLFADAREEVVEELHGLDVSYGIGISWRILDVDVAEVELNATRRLLSEIGAHPELKQRILRFALRPLAAIRDPSARDLAVSSFNTDVHLARDYARYLVQFADDMDVIEGLADVLEDFEWKDPYLLMHAIAVLMESREVPRAVVSRLLNVYSGHVDDTCRALAAIAIARLGDGRHRQDLMASFGTERSEYVRSALLFASQFFVEAQRRTAKLLLGSSSDLNAEIAARVL